MKSKRIHPLTATPPHAIPAEYNTSTVIVNLARRAHDHNWELDPITRSLLDTDFYKLLMLQFIWKHYPTTRATFTLMNRSHDVPLGDIVDVRELREQLESTRKRRRRISDLKPERSGVEEPAVIPRNKYKVPASMSVSAFFKIDLNVRL